MEISAIRPVSGGETRSQLAATPPPAPAPTGGNAAPEALVATSAISAGEMPVDADRVSQIRKAIQSGSYPVIPTKISDAMIAAGIMLQVRK